jgi:hypothetical protein
MFATMSDQEVFDKLPLSEDAKKELWMKLLKQHKDSTRGACSSEMTDVHPPCRCETECLDPLPQSEVGEQQTTPLAQPPRVQED